MIALHWLVAIGMAVAAQDGAQPDTAAPAVEPPSPATVTKIIRGDDVVKRDVAAFASQCGARKFETTATSNNNGKARKAKILLCAKDGESDEQWIATLEKAASAVVASTELSIEAKAKIAGELQAEIARLRDSN